MCVKPRSRSKDCCWRLPCRSTTTVPEQDAIACHDHARTAPTSAARGAACCACCRPALLGPEPPLPCMSPPPLARFLPLRPLPPEGPFSDPSSLFFCPRAPTLASFWASPGGGMSSCTPDKPGGPGGMMFCPLGIWFHCCLPGVGPAGPLAALCAGLPRAGMLRPLPLMSLPRPCVHPGRWAAGDACK